MPLFSKSKSTLSGSSSGIGLSSASSAKTADSGKGQEEDTHSEGHGSVPKGNNIGGTSADHNNDPFSFSSASGSSPGIGTTTSRMSSSFNQSSSYNRTFERKVIEESTPTVTTTRMFTSSPLQNIKSTLSSGLGSSGFPSDFGTLGGLGTGGTSFVQPHNYQFGSATSGSFTSSDNELSATMDCAAFAPEELKVSVVGNQIVVEGKHAEKQDSLGTIERHFVRKFALPRNAPAESVTSNLTGNGMLTVTASAPSGMKDNSPARTIPIKIVPGQQQNGQQQQAQNGQ